jgi:hypothetical protein
LPRTRALWREDDYVLGGDIDTNLNGNNGRWIAWSAASRLAVVQGTGNALGLAGGVLAISEATQLAMYSAASGALLGTIPGVSAQAYRTTAGLAVDGSYVWAARETGLSVWSPSGAPVRSIALNYGLAQVYAAPGRLLVGAGAGQNVIETVYTNGDPSTTSQTFSGNFSNWFTDGTKFFARSGSNFFVYSADATQLQFVAASVLAERLGGYGAYFWSYRAGTLDIYQVGGNGTPVKTITGTEPVVAASRHQLAFIVPSTGAITVFNLDATPLTEQALMVPYEGAAYASDRNGFWAAGGEQGQVTSSGASSVPGQPGPLGCGTVLSKMGSSASVVALGTAGGGLKVIDLSVPALASIDLTAKQVKVSGDGHTVMAAVFDRQPSTDRSVYAYKWPAWGLDVTFAHSRPTTLTVEFDMSLDANVVGRTMNMLAGVQTAVTDYTGTVPIWSGTHSLDSLVPKFSPNGRYFAITTGWDRQSYATRLYDGGVLQTTVPGRAVGWFDNGRLLVQTYIYNQGSRYDGTKIYGPTGNVVSTPTLPELTGFDVIGPSRIFSYLDSNVYDVSGTLVASLGLPENSVVAGPFIISISGMALQATRY